MNACTILKTFFKQKYYCYKVECFFFVGFNFFVSFIVRFYLSTHRLATPISDWFAVWIKNTIWADRQINRAIRWHNPQRNGQQIESGIIPGFGDGGCTATILRIMNDTAYIEAAAKCIWIKPRTKYRVPWKSIAITEKRDSMKKLSLLNKINPTNANVQKFKISQRTNIYKKEQCEYIPA